MNTKKWLKRIKDRKLLNLLKLLFITFFVFNCNKNDRFEELGKSTKRVFSQFNGIGYSNKMITINGIKLNKFSFGRELQDFDIFIGQQNSEIFFCPQKNIDKEYILFSKKSKCIYHYEIPLNTTSNLIVDSNEKKIIKENCDEIYLAKFHISGLVFTNDTIIMKYSFKNGIVGMIKNSHRTNLNYHFQFYPNFKYKIKVKDSSVFSI
jgi:hypothetical protein